MKPAKIYIHTEGNSAIKTAEVDLEQPLAAALKKEGVNVDDDIYIYIDDEHHSEPKDKHEKCDTHGIKDKHHIHCHRCKDVSVVIEYNGVGYDLRVPPSATGSSLLAKAGHKFAITPGDLKELRLKVSDDVFVEPKEHIGAFVVYPQCHIMLSLVPKKLVQG